MCNEIEKRIEKYNDFDASLEKFKIGNSSVGYWNYNVEYELEKHPEIEITCTIFETLGERRLTSHLLGGLDILLRYGILSCNAENIRNKLSHRKSSKSSDDKEFPISTFTACCGNSAIPCDFVNDDCDLTFDISSIRSISSSWAEEDLKKEWNELCNTLDNFNNSDKKTYKNFIAYLYWRLGREVGEFLRFLQVNEIMWGYFFDYNPCEPHCNSHPNNYVVINPSQRSLNGNEKPRFLAPLDFDMTFTKETFYNPNEEKVFSTDEIYDGYKTSEISEMENALSGDQANSGINIEQDSSNDHLPKSSFDNEHFDLVSNSMRDTLLSGCRSCMF